MVSPASLSITFITFTLFVFSFSSMSCPPERRKFFEMSSFVETKGMDTLKSSPIEFVEYPLEAYKPSENIIQRFPELKNKNGKVLTSELMISTEMLFICCSLQHVRNSVDTHPPPYRVIP